MAAFLHDFALLQHDNLVGVPDRGESVGNHDASLLSSLNEFIQGFLDLVLALCVECARGLVKKDHLRLANQGPSDGDTLLLATREPDTSLTNETIEAFREVPFVLDEREAVGHAAGVTEALRDLGLAGALEVNTVEDVVPDAAREENRFLLHKRDLLLMVPLVVQVFQVGA